MTRGSALLFTSSSITKDDFYYFQFFAGRGKFLVYRAIFMLIFVGGFACHLVWSSRNENLAIYWFYLTHWIELVVVLHFLVSFSAALKGWLTRTNKPEILEVTDIKVTNQVCLKEISSREQKIESEIQDGVNIKIAPINRMKELSVKEEPRVSFLEALTWLLYELAFVGSYTVTFIFWIFLRKKNEDDHSTSYVVLNIFQHGFNCLAVTMDAVLSRYPARFIHAIYGIFLGIFYVLFTFLLHIIRLSLNSDTDVPEKIYWFLDWGSGSFYPVYLCLVMIPITFLLQSFLLLLHWTRNRISSRINDLN